jgi:5'-3' exonuclease
MLKRSRSSYKELARKATPHDCLVSDNAIDEIVVDIRSRVFKYIRQRYVSRTLDHRVESLFRAIKDLEQEIKAIANDALVYIRKDVSLLKVKKVTYVTGSSTKCPYKETIYSERESIAKTKASCLQDSIKQFKRNMFDTESLMQCITALESYIIADFERVASICNSWTFCVRPTEDDMFESDKLCARSAKSAILGEDLDCIALFGASAMLIKDVYKKFFSYIMPKDIMEVFNVNTQKDLVYKCIILGTDYNYGLKGMGPVRVLKIDDSEEMYDLAKKCLSLQDIDIDKFIDEVLAS